MRAFSAAVLDDGLNVGSHEFRHVLDGDILLAGLMVWGTGQQPIRDLVISSDQFLPISVQGTFQERWRPYAFDKALMESSRSRVQVELLDRQAWSTRLGLATALFD